MTDFDRENWLQDNIDLLNFAGMYSNEKKHVIRVYVSCILMSFYLVTGFGDMVYNCENVDQYIELFTGILPSGASLVFLLLFVSNRKTLFQVVDILRNKFLVHDHSIKAEMMGIRLVKYSKLYLYFVVFVYLLMLIQSYVEREGGDIHDGKGNGLPVRAYYPIDLSKKQNISLALFSQFITIIIIVHITIPIATAFASLLIHLRGQLFDLQESLLKVCECEDIKEQRILLNKCVAHHTILIEFTEKMQTTFSSILAIHNYSPSIVISVAGFQATQMSILDPKFLPYVSLMNYVVIECFIYCYYGQHIIDESSSLGFVAYSNKWYNCPPDIGRDLSLIVLRCQKPLQMVFVGSASASLETFYNIMKTGYSYFMFLASMGEANDEM